ncbi:S24 family peptidase [Paenibacillus larvae]|nr:S24 family peptidase [Paenibacillus larvae]MDT2262426.1 S24 family peptidase [Paenibacillus larvae]
MGTICAGDGLLAEQNIEEYINYPFPNKRQPDFALRVKGDSMIGAGIKDGDIIYMKKASWAEHNGQIVAAIVNDCMDGMLKRMRWEEGTPIIRLEPENKDFNVIEAYPNQIIICGIYMGHFSE